MVEERTKIPSGGGLLDPDYTVIYHNDDRNLYVEGCGLSKLPEGALIAVVPVVPSATKGGWAARPSTTRIMQSTDKGRTWNQVYDLPFYTATPWVHDGALYLFASSAGTAYRNDDLFLLRSEDGGASWTEPTLLFAGHYWNCPTGMVIRDGRIYWALCEFYGSAGTSPRAPRVIAGDLSGPLDATSWRMSNRPEFPGIPETFLGQGGDGFREPWLEQNVIEADGRLRVICRVKNGTSLMDVCGVLDLEDDGTSLDLRFTQFHPMPGGHLKFSIVYDEVSRLFWTPANPGTKYADRRYLMLLHSLDGLNWLHAGRIAAAASLQQSFMYGDCVVDGDDLIVASRTSSGADGMHNADYATFHRIANFRRLALPGMTASADR